jgi:DNA-binding GntR family transcriptional regulator
MPIPGPRDVKADRSLVREEVYATVRGWIVDGTLEPGEKLRDADLAGAMGVSRMPVREALRRLEDEGFVQTAANRWTRVAPLDFDEACDLYPILWSLESLALSLARGHLVADDLRAMRQANARLERALAAGDAVGALEADYGFHQVFIRRSDNPRLVAMIDDLKVKLRRLDMAYFKGSSVTEQSVAEHRRIQEALEAGDHEGAAWWVRINWEESFRRVREYAGYSGQTQASSRAARGVRNTERGHPDYGPTRSTSRHGAQGDLARVRPDCDRP